MSKLKDKTIFITGASSGIGKACAEQFAKQGANVIVTARRLERIQTLADRLADQYNINTLAIELDVQNRKHIDEVINDLSPKWKNIDILVNNAGLALTSDLMQEANPDNWDTMIDTNIKGLLYVTHALLPVMIERGQGHIVNVGSIAGHEYYPRGNVYSATKHAVKAISQSLRLDCLGTGIRVTNISPGAVETEFSDVRWKDKERAKSFYDNFNPLQADDIADSIIYATSRPSHVDIAELIIMPTDQASCNNLHSKTDTDAKGIFQQK